MEQFFSADDLCDLTGMLKQIEQAASCEVVVRIVRDKIGTDQAARSEFMRLGLDRSTEKTGLLLYINLFHRRFIFLAGDGIVARLGKSWLEAYADMLEDRFRKYQFGFGLHDVIARIGRDLMEHFPLNR